MNNKTLKNYERTLSMLMEKIYKRKQFLLEKEYRTEVLGIGYSIADDLEIKYMYVRADQIATVLACENYVKKNDTKTTTVSKNDSCKSSREKERAITSADLREIWEAYISRKHISTPREDS